MENIFDTHSHYTDSAFDEDRDAVLQSIHNNGVKYIMLALIPQSFKTDLKRFCMVLGSIGLQVPVMI